MNELKLDMVRPDVRKLIEPYLQKMINLHRNNITAIVLYGSATGGDYSLKTSDVNLMIVFGELDFLEMNRSLKLVSDGINKKIAAPLFLSLTHVDTSKDVFPLEFSDIKDNHLLLYGEDLFKNMEINQSHTRLICEQQIKGKLIRIRQAYLEIGLKAKGVEALMKESLNALIPVFRGLMRAKDVKPAVEKEEVINQMAASYRVDPEVFITIMRDKKNDDKIAGKDVSVYFERYVGQLKKLALAVDQL